MSTTTTPTINEKELSILKAVYSGIYETSEMSTSTEISEKSLPAFITNLKKKGLLAGSKETLKLTDLGQSYLMKLREEAAPKEALPEPEPEVKTKAASAHKASVESKSVSGSKHKKSSPSREIAVDFKAKDPEAAPEADTEMIPITAGQKASIEELKVNVPKWDKGTLEKSKVKLVEDQVHFLTKVVRENGTIVRRDLIIGHNGAIRAFGQKAHSKHIKLLRAFDDVVAYGKTEKVPEA